MSLYGALNIGVAGLSANSAALSATSSNIANVNTVGYKDETANFETFLNAPGLVGNASAGVAAVNGQDVTSQGLPTQTSSPTDLSISGNGFFVVSTRTGPSVKPKKLRGPVSAGLSAGFLGQYPDQHQPAQPDQCHQSGGQGGSH